MYNKYSYDYFSHLLLVKYILGNRANGLNNERYKYSKIYIYIYIGIMKNITKVRAHGAVGME